MKAKEFHQMFLKINKFLKTNKIEHILVSYDGSEDAVSIDFIINGEMEYITSEDLPKFISAVEAADGDFMEYDEFEMVFKFHDGAEVFSYGLNEFPSCIPSPTIARYIAAYYILHNKTIAKHDQQFIGNSAA